MSTQVATKSFVNERSSLLAMAWLGTLLASLLPGIIWQESFAGEVSQALWLRIGSVAVMLALSLVWKIVRPLSGYFSMLLAMIAADEFLRPLIANSPMWQGWFGAEGTPLFWRDLSVQLLRLLMAGAAWMALALMGLKRREFFLVKGQTDAPAEPVRWLDIKENQNWTRVGR
jgi:hypothetical protein